MSEGYRRIFWGIFIATFNLKFGIITILPAFVGFFIVSSGVGKIIKESHLYSFKKAKSYANILAVLLILGDLISILFYNANSHILIQLIPVLYITLEILVFYKIFEGTIEKQKLDKNKLSTDDFTNKLGFYLIISLLNTIIMCFSLSLNIAWLSTITAFVVIIIRIFLMTTMSRLKKIYLEENPEAK